MYKKLIVLTLVLALTSFVSAGTTLQWTGASDDTSWEDAMNWDLAYVPTASDTLVKIHKSVGDATVVVSAAGAQGGLKLKAQLGNVTLTINDDADLTVGGSVEAYQGTTQTFNIDGTLNITAGTCKWGGQGSTADMYVDGTLNCISSTTTAVILQVGYRAVGAGYVHIGPTGVINADAYQIVCAVGAVGAIDFISGSSGKLIVKGDVRAQVGTDRFLERFMVDGVAQVNGVKATYDPGTNKTTIEIPEPTTIALLGLGGLALLRRRR